MMGLVMKLFSAQKVSVSKSFQKGFTLIELLVVIGILGILAAALVATIDPFEQLNKASDARRENTLVEFQNGLLRYYTIKGTMPWEDPVDNCNGGVAPAALALATTGTESDCVTALIDQGELKTSYANSPDLEDIFITETGPNAATMCYMPSSKSKQRDPNTNFDNDGSAPTAQCKSTGGSADCYWCTQ